MGIYIFVDTLFRVNPSDWLLFCYVMFLHSLVKKHACIISPTPHYFPTKTKCLISKRRNSASYGFVHTNLNTGVLRSHSCRVCEALM